MLAGGRVLVGCDSQFAAPEREKNKTWDSAHRELRSGQWQLALRILEKLETPDLVTFNCAGGQNESSPFWGFEEICFLFLFCGRKGALPRLEREEGRTKIYLGGVSVCIAQGLLLGFSCPQQGVDQSDPALDSSALPSGTLGVQTP